jgi:hypothetical protein
MRSLLPLKLEPPPMVLPLQSQPVHPMLKLKLSLPLKVKQQMRVTMMLPLHQRQQPTRALRPVTQQSPQEKQPVRQRKKIQQNRRLMPPLRKTLLYPLLCLHRLLPPPQLAMESL